MTTPEIIKQSLASIIEEHFGSVNELESLLPTSELNYIFNFPNNVVIYKAWDLSLDLISLGKNTLDEYQILDKHLNLIKTVYNSNNINSNINVLKYISDLKHGDYFHIVFKTTNGLKVLLIWVSKELPKKQKESLVAKWAAAKNTYQPTYFKKGEIVINNKLGGQLLAYYLPGEYSSSVTLDNILTNKDVTLVLNSDKQSISFNVALNGWYAFILITNNQVDLVQLTNITGIGIQKVRQNNGVVYFSLLGHFDSQLEGIDRLTTNRLSIECELDYALSPVELPVTNISIDTKSLLADYNVRQFNRKTTVVTEVIDNKTTTIEPMVLLGELYNSNLDIVTGKTLITRDYIVQDISVITQSIDLELSRKRLQILP